MILLRLIAASSLMCALSIGASAAAPKKPDIITFHSVTHEQVEPCKTCVTPYDALQKFKQGVPFIIRLNNRDSLCQIAKHPRITMPNEIGISSTQAIMHLLDQIKNLLLIAKRKETAEKQAELKQKIASLDQEAADLARRKARLLAEHNALNDQKD